MHINQVAGVKVHFWLFGSFIIMATNNIRGIGGYSSAGRYGITVYGDCSKIPYTVIVRCITMGYTKFITKFITPTPNNSVASIQIRKILAFK